MTDWPDNLIDTLAKDYASRVEGIVSRSSGPVDVCRFHREWAEDFLAALAEWCDGDLYDPTTGQRIVKRHVCDGDWDDDGDDRRAITAVQAVLRERGLLLGPDGLLRADEQRWASGMFASFMRTGDEEDDAPHVPLFTLSPLDPPEDTP